LVARFGDGQVFMDLDMELGVDFVEQINDAVGSCRLLVAVVGPRWVTVEDAPGRRRLDDPADFVRVEVEAGLGQADVRVVPLLVQGARMPGPDELPAPLADFARLHALELSDARWRYDVDRLAATAERVLGSDSAGGAPEGADGAGRRAERRRRRGRVDEGSAGAIPHGARTRPALSGLFRGHGRLAIVVALLALLVAVGVALVASGGGDGRASKRVSEFIPADVREHCHKSQDPWITRDHRAVEQQDCQPLPRAVRSVAGRDGDASYALFRSTAAAQDFVENDFEYALDEQNGTSCGSGARARLEAQYSGGDARCYTYAEGVVINWRYSDAPVGVQLYFDPATSVKAAVEARAQLL
jgi:hypothetical protein